jgi:FlgD Ig-like domain
MPLALPPRTQSQAATSFFLMFLAALLAAPAFAQKKADFSTIGVKRSGAQLAGTSGMLATSAVNNLPLCAAANDQSAPVYVSDGNGGSIAVWSDRRGGNYDIYAQKVDGNGDALWASYGVVVTKAAGDQINPQAVSDGAGGVIVVWEDRRSGDPLEADIYAQRLNSTGIELWATDGVLVSGAAGSQQAPIVVSDGLSGAILAWRDARSGTGDIYARRVPANGVPAWTIDGVAVCVANSDQDQPAAVSDGSGGVLLSWRDLRNGNADIYARRVANDGTPAWAADGVAVCTATGDQEPPAATPDGTGGMILAWGDPRGATTDIFAQRVNGSGAAQWAANGVSVCAATGNQTRARLCQDGSSGAIVTWEDRRGANSDVYAQRVNSAGAAQWTANGVVVCNAAADQLTPTIAADPMGGAVIAWSDLRTVANGADVYTQKVNLAGAVSWTANGTLVCDTTGDQVSPGIVSDGQGGAQMAWRDFRGGAVADLYGQRVDASGAIPAQCVGEVLLTEGSPVTATNPLSFYSLNQDAFFWGGIGVRSAASTDWDVELYEPYTFAQTAFPVCYRYPLAGSYQSGLVDFVIGDFNPGYTEIPPPAFTPGIRVTRYSGTGNATVEFDGAENTMTKDCSGGNCGASSGNNWNQVFDVWDVYLFAGQPYTFDFTKTGADIRFMLFAPPATPSSYIVPRSARLFEAAGRYTVYTPTVTGWHAAVFTNENGVNGTYSAQVTTGVLTTDVGDGAQVGTGLRGVAPNPARGAVRVNFALKHPADVSMRVLDMAGRRVAEIPSQHWGAGAWSVAWDGRNASGQSLAAGVYFVEMMVDGQRVGQSRLALLR